MNERKSRIKLLPVEVVLRIILGGKEAEEFLVQQYDKMIDYYINKYIRINRLNAASVPKEDIKQEIRMDLVKAVRNFKI